MVEKYTVDLMGFRRGTDRSFIKDWRDLTRKQYELMCDFDEEHVYDYTEHNMRVHVKMYYHEDKFITQMHRMRCS